MLVRHRAASLLTTITAAVFVRESNITAAGQRQCSSSRSSGGGGGGVATLEAAAVYGVYRVPGIYMYVCYKNNQNVKVLARQSTRVFAINIVKKFFHRT